MERLEDGEVSGFLHDVVEIGDELDVRGPIGGYFVWDGATPALLLGGGSGIVPLMAMLRLARADGSRPTWSELVVSVRSPDDLYYAARPPGPETTVIYTRRGAPASARPPGRHPPRTWCPVYVRTRRCSSAARRRSPTRRVTCCSSSASLRSASAWSA